MTARKLPPPERLKQLLETFDHARYPILIHCQGGSDRTGLASTLYENQIEHIPLDQAEQAELTLRYGHFSYSSGFHGTGNGLRLSPDENRFDGLNTAQLENTVSQVTVPHEFPREFDDIK